tara:strand:+ start:206 stop:367 length:162 start_codon:yes stop_codon:yes gene_type:complete
MAAPGDPKRIATSPIVAARQRGQQTGGAWASLSKKTQQQILRLLTEKLMETGT